MIVWIVYTELDGTTPQVNAVFADKELAQKHMERMVRNSRRGLSSVPITFENLGGEDLTPSYQMRGQTVYAHCFAHGHEVIGAQD